MQGTPAGRPIKVPLDSRFDVSGFRFFARSVVTFRAPRRPSKSRPVPSLRAAGLLLRATYVVRPTRG